MSCSTSSTPPRRPRTWPISTPSCRCWRWLGKPVLVLLNQLGAPSARRRGRRGAPLAHAHRPAAGAREVLAFDAFARCWVQEGALLSVSPTRCRRRAARVRAAARGLAERGARTCALLCRSLAERSARAALDREPVPEAGWRPAGSSAPRSACAATAPRRRRARRCGRWPSGSTPTPRLDRSPDPLHGLGGHATARCSTRLREHYAVHEPLDEGRAAVWAASSPARSPGSRPTAEPAA